MSSEKMAVLKMLDEGKISAEDASKLLASLETQSSESAERKTAGSQTPPSENASKDIAAELGRSLAGLGKTAKDAVGRNVRIRKIAGAAIEKTVEIADSVSKSLQESIKNSPDTRSHTKSERAEAPLPSSGRAAPSRSKTLEQRIDTNCPNELILKIPHGSISVKGYNGDAATITLAGGRSFAGFLKLGNVYTFDCGDLREKIDADVFVPRTGFKKITVCSEGGMVTIDNAEADSLLVNTSSCHVLIKNLNARLIKIDNINGAVAVSSVSGEELTAENSNGAIDVSNADFKTVRLETTSEPVTVISQGFYAHSSYNWSIRTSNARLKAVLPSVYGLGYSLKARTSLSDVSSGLTGIVYSRNDRNYIEGKSEGFDACPKKARLELETSNAPIAIN